MEPLKKQFLELLDKDLEFRYAVAGYLGLSEILKRLDDLSEEQVKLREEQVSLRKEQTKIWEEIRGLREGQSKLMEEHAKIWREIRSLREEQTKIWKEVAGLREEQTKIWNEIRVLREEQIKLREEQISLREEQTKLREDFNKMLKVVEGLQRGHRRLEKGFRRFEDRLDSLRNAMISGLGEVSKFAGLTFEEFVRRFLTAQLKSSGELSEDAELKKTIIDGEEINIFSEEPLIVGEVTAHAETVDEIKKLLKKAEHIKAKYKREPRKLLVALTAPNDVAKELKRIADENSIELIIGKTV